MAEREGQIIGITIQLADATLGIEPADQTYTEAVGGRRYQGPIMNLADLQEVEQEPTADKEPDAEQQPNTYSSEQPVPDYGLLI